MHTLADCPANCGNGYCLNNMKCYCNAGFFGIDCSVPAKEITAGSPAQVGMPYNNNLYFYFQITESPGMLIFVFQKPRGVQANVLISTQANDNFELPKDIAHGLPFPSDSTVLSQDFSKNVLTQNIGRKIVIRIQAQEKLEEFSIEVDYSSEENLAMNRSLVMLISICIVLIVVFFMIVLCMFKRRIDSVDNHRYVVPSPEPELLTKEEIEHYFPPKEFSKFENPLNQKTCCICLEDFNPKILCMQFYCHHIHHDKCIEEWFERHNTCPECREPITIHDIKEHIKKEKEHDHDHDHRGSIHHSDVGLSITQIPAQHA